MRTKRREKLKIGQKCNFIGKVSVTIWRVYHHPKSNPAAARVRADHPIFVAYCAAAPSHKCPMAAAHRYWPMEFSPSNSTRMSCARRTAVPQRVHRFSVQNLLGMGTIGRNGARTCCNEMHAACSLFTIEGGQHLTLPRALSYGNGLGLIEIPTGPR